MIVYTILLLFLTIINADFNSSFQYRGISLGGWLVLEPYITPTLFNDTLLNNETFKDIPVDEFHYCSKLGTEEAKSRLENHWDTFYNETDFEQIKSYGLNMVRIPVGYWSFKKFNNDPYVQGAQDYLDKAIEWCSKNDLKVMIDLHGAPFSQNGFDNSGLRNIGYPGWQNKTEYVNQTLEVLQLIYGKYGSSTYSDTVIGVEVLNEPLGPKLNMNKIKKFYIDSYNDARVIQEVNNTLFYHDVFESIGYWDSFFKDGNLTYRNDTNETIHESTDFTNIVVDHHHYEVFGNVVGDNVSQHLQNIENYASSIADEKHPAIVGEWSAALTDCTPWLNGVGLGNRYEGSEPYDNKPFGKCSTKKWSTEDIKDHRRFVEMQLYQYEKNTQGWIFWCWKTEGQAVEWDFKQLVELKVIPQPLNDYQYIKNGKDISGASTLNLNLNIYHYLTFAFIVLSIL
ncbi:exgA [Candida jiufengensis]|uniref:exgA n=1 Tax=Candida jiufengensis TaxID=497108 RepID=UPI0022245428|nr:exgA [Candida jiufengensis]KAI5953332.1 exgA [Candida jiufengensis]